MADWIDELAATWSGQDPAAAMDWLVTLPENADRRELVRSTFSDWVEFAPRPAEAWARSAPPADGVGRHPGRDVRLGQEDDGELQPLGAMDRHDADCVATFDELRRSQLGFMLGASNASKIDSVRLRRTCT